MCIRTLSCIYVEKVSIANARCFFHEAFQIIAICFLLNKGLRSLHQLKFPSPKLPEHFFSLLHQQTWKQLYR